jgi:hypothetical protein
MGKRDAIENELERDSQIYDAFTKGHGEGRIAGLKEALEIVDRHRKGWTVSAATAGLVAEVMQTASEIISEAIRSRIAELEKGNPNG